MESSRGPTLLDLADIYDTCTDTVSFMFLFASVGMLMGSPAGTYIYALLYFQLA